MEDREGSGSTDQTPLPALFGVVAGVRWIILIIALLFFGLALLLDVGELPAAVVSGLLGIGLAHFTTRQREIEAEQRLRDREIKADQRLREREIEASQRQRKIEAYQAFMDTFFHVILRPVQMKVFTDKGLNPDDYQTTLDMNPMIKQLTLWGSDEALRSYLDLLDKNIMGRTRAPVPGIDDFCEMFLILRRDVGYENNGLDKYRLYPIFGIHPPEALSGPTHIDPAA